VPIDVRCPGCRADIQAPDRLAGKLIRCTSCREEFRVGRDENYDQYISEQEPRPKPVRRRSAGTSKGLIAGGSVAVAVLLTILGVGVRLMRVGAKLRTDPIPAMTSQVVTLSNLRRDGTGYSVDYAFTGAPAVAQGFALKVRRKGGTAEVPFPFLWQKPQGTIAVSRIGGRAADSGPVDVYFVRFGGERVSNVETLN
jgi:hypothetical protein